MKVSEKMNIVKKGLIIVALLCFAITILDIIAIINIGNIRFIFLICGNVSIIISIVIRMVQKKE